jgi:hypothetical protein
MTFDQLITELRKLNRIQKLQAMQVLVNELAIEEDAFIEVGAVYPIYTPHGNEAAAQTLYDYLQQESSVR